MNPNIIIGIVVAAISLGLIAVVVISSISNERELKRAEELILAQYLAWRKMVDRHGKLPARPIYLNLMSGEVGYMQMRAVLCETRSVRNATHTGGTIRIARGITLGRGYSASESHEEWREISPGILYITNQRIVFDGEMQNRNMKIKDILSVQAAGSQVAISVSTRQKTMVFDGVNGLIVRGAIQLIRSGDCDGAKSAAVPATPEQIDYIRSLGGTVPKNLTRDDAYRLIEEMIHAEDETESEEEIFARRQQAEADLQAVAAAMDDPDFKPRRIRSKRIRDLREFQGLVNRIIADNVIEPHELLEVKRWLIEHKMCRDDFAGALAVFDAVLADGKIDETETQHIYENMLDCISELKSRPQTPQE